MSNLTIWLKEGKSTSDLMFGISKEHYAEGKFLGYLPLDWGIYLEDGTIYNSNQ